MANLFRLEAEGSCSACRFALHGAHSLKAKDLATFIDDRAGCLADSENRSLQGEEKRFHWAMSKSASRQEETAVSTEQPLCVA